MTSAFAAVTAVTATAPNTHDGENAQRIMTDETDRIITAWNWDREVDCVGRRAREQSSTA
jgi:hypothetical protein